MTDTKEDWLISWSALVSWPRGAWLMILLGLTSSEADSLYSRRGSIARERLEKGFMGSSIPRSAAGILGG